jgi:hypothetical protein
LFAPQLAALWTHGAVMVASTLEGGTMAEIAGALLAHAPSALRIDRQQQSRGRAAGRRGPAPRSVILTGDQNHSSRRDENGASCRLR